MNKESLLFSKEKRHINKKCLLASNGFEPFDRCSSCTLKAPQCMGLQYNLFIITIAMMLLMFLFLENSILIRINIVSIIVLMVVMGYRVMVNSDDLARASFENIALTQELKLHAQTLQGEVLRQTKELKSLAIHDRLTGLYNRYEFENSIKSSFIDAHENNVQHVLCYLDLDQFKIVNDTSGHVAGDELLKQLSLLLEEALEGKAFLSRIGGDEFGIIIHQSTIEEATTIMEHVLSLIRSYRFSWKDKLFRVGASIGMVAITRESNSVYDLMIAADTACYMAKDNGRNRIYTFGILDPAVAEHRNDMQWIEEIDSALKENRFELYGQPIQPVNFHDGIPHFELLIRMKDKAGKIIEPMAFIPTAERYNRMVLIDRWVVTEAIHLLREILNEKQQCQFSINLSGQSFGDDSFLDFIKSLFLETEIPYECICFEVTETAAISNLSTALSFIKELRALGCCFSLDDFGTGLSSFAYLKNIPVDYVKIDGQFVLDIHRNPVNYQMVKSIHEIARVMNIKTIGEYVENQDVLKSLNDIGIDYAQGNYFCVASSIQECISKYKSGKAV